jgi:ferritin-like metal-binding protein YciE
MVLPAFCSSIWKSLVFLFGEKENMYRDNLLPMLHQQLQMLYSMEMQILNSAPALKRCVSSRSLMRSLLNHFVETNAHVDRLNQIAQLLECQLHGSVCRAMETILEENLQSVTESGSSIETDLRILATMQQIESFEVAAYAAAVSLAEKLEFHQVLDLLNRTLEEERSESESLEKVQLPAIFMELMPDGQHFISKKIKAPSYVAEEIDA